MSVIAMLSCISKYFSDLQIIRGYILRIVLVVIMNVAQKVII